MTKSDSKGIQSYLFDLAKIIDGASNSDYDRVVAYTEQLSNRLKDDGQPEAAKRLLEILSRSKAKTVSLARATGTSRSVPVDSESRMSLATEESWEIEQAPVYLSQEVANEVERFLRYFRAADQLIASGVGVSPSMLVYGPPGCGKTQLARHIAAELKLPLITGRSDGMISSYLGSTAKNLRSLFEHAMSRPCVLFLDEFDAIAKMRDDGRELGELKRVVISLLQNIDAMGKDHVLIAATNHEHLLDPAIWRRFAFKLKLSEPADEARLQMLKSFLRDFATSDEVEILVALTAGMNGAQIKQTAEDAIREAVLEGSTRVSLPRMVDSILAASDHSMRAMPESDKIKAVRDRLPKQFTQRRLAKVFDISQGQVSKMLSAAGDK